MEAEWKCNLCGETVYLKLGWKIWTPFFCKEFKTKARAYRVSAPSIKVKIGDKED